MPDPEPRISRSGVCSYRVGAHVSIAGAERDYGVVVRYPGGVNPIVRLPGDYELIIGASGRLHRIPPELDVDPEVHLLRPVYRPRYTPDWLRQEH